jgi:hypothetical protein
MTTFKQDAAPQVSQGKGFTDPPPWKTPPKITDMALKGVSVKGRSSHEEKEAWAKGAQLLLGEEPWLITDKTDFTEIEQMVVVLIKYLEHWTEMHSSHYEWCVGASLQATYDGRDSKGRTTSMFLRLCTKSDWTGNARGKVGNTCKTCCDGINLTLATVRGIYRGSVTLKKCTWLKCCYGRRPFGGPPQVTWSARCEQQKKMLAQLGQPLPTAMAESPGGEDGEDDEEHSISSRKRSAPEATRGGKSAKASKADSPRAGLPKKLPKPAGVAAGGARGTKKLPKPRAVAAVKPEAIGRRTAYGRRTPDVPLFARASAGSPAGRRLGLAGMSPITPRGRAAAAVMTTLCEAADPLMGETLMSPVRPTTAAARAAHRKYSRRITEPSFPGDSCQHRRARHAAEWRDHAVIATRLRVPYRAQRHHHLISRSKFRVLGLGLGPSCATLTVGCTAGPGLTLNAWKLNPQMPCL